ncbi:hypothetical protein BCV69DRAFT_275032 [Microstroma glucosiphilum]|uniref:Uncharacterized protein n=1 Tax=Pseudomicrostroma glucosiphilum TaxID=1684307 RepID=A0A316UHU6_9BASI|nr:hypothetical protein BCV69DRAFT_275032 [Pseudomicrostroma glucosiphilum]PWN23503.1 hypothetical protein BCV69DRAFT_275032 [Pseudomicrostroma glucosiphilum]
MKLLFLALPGSLLLSALLAASQPLPQHMHTGSPPSLALVERSGLGNWEPTDGITRVFGAGRSENSPESSGWVKKTKKAPVKVVKGIYKGLKKAGTAIKKVVSKSSGS